MKTFITIVALLAVVTASLVLMSGEDAVMSTYVPVDGTRSDVGRQDARKMPAASPRTSSEHEPSLARVGPDRAALIGLMMMLGGHPGR